jgi:hypothetical protein
MGTRRGEQEGRGSEGGERIQNLCQSTSIGPILSKLIHILSKKIPMKFTIAALSTLAVASASSFVQKEQGVDVFAR